jgi:isopentenyl phosphate kinase
MLECPLTFLKLGGSLITDKNQAETLRPDVLEACLTQVNRWLQENPNARLVLGHGSGSFGHHAAREFHTREGVVSHRDWFGYAAVWQSARKLNDFFIKACVQSGIAVVDFPISAAVITENRKVGVWNLDALTSTLVQAIVPVVHGDVCIDRTLGGTILSTEEIFGYLASQLKPARVLLAGVEIGVYQDHPENKQLITHIPANVSFRNYLQGSKAQDVTGGMASKVILSQTMAQNLPGLEVRIFSGFESDAIYKVLSGEALGTSIS